MRKNGHPLKIRNSQSFEECGGSESDALQYRHDELRGRCGTGNARRREEVGGEDRESEDYRSNEFGRRVTLEISSQPRANWSSVRGLTIDTGNALSQFKLYQTSPVATTNKNPNNAALHRLLLVLSNNNPTARPVQTYPWAIDGTLYNVKSLFEIPADFDFQLQYNSASFPCPTNALR